jgi:hypothetical protein
MSYSHTTNTTRYKEENKEEGTYKRNLYPKRAID